MVNFMGNKLPRRPRAHQLESESEAFLLANIPCEWTRDSPRSDYGVDLRIGLAVQGKINGQQLVIQLKASDRSDDPNFVFVDLKTSTLLLLRGMLEVAMLVKYVSLDKEAYWFLLKNFTKQPRNDQEKIRIRIPKTNKVSTLPWNEVAQHVDAVHWKKLNANR